MPPPSTAVFNERVRPREIALLGFLLLTGIAAGVFACRQLAHLRSAHEAEMTQRSRNIARLRSENERLLQREPQPQTEKTSPLTGENVAPSAESTVAPRTARMIALVSVAKVMSHGLSPFVVDSRFAPAFVVTAGNQLPARFGELFDLGESEVARLQQTLTAARDRVDELTAANTTLRPGADGSYILEVKALAPEQIAADRDRLIATFREVLGPDGFRAFALFNHEAENPESNRGMRQIFQISFGAIGRTATVSKTSRGSYRYAVEYDDGAHASGGAATLDELQQRVGGGIKLIPPGF